MAAGKQRRLADRPGVGCGAVQVGLEPGLHVGQRPVQVPLAALARQTD